MDIDTRIIKDFISESEISEIESIVERESTGMVYNDYNHPEGHHVSDTWSFQLETKAFERVNEILRPKINENFGSDLIVNQSHILHSFYPYGVHTDVLAGGFDLTGPYEPAWTLLIPLDNFDSHTILFEEECVELKEVQQWVEKYNIQPKYNISDEQYQKYFTHHYKPHLDYLTIEEIFPWQGNKGTCFAASRKKFHCSDNYLDKTTTKRAIIMWTSFEK